MGIPYDVVEAATWDGAEQQAKVAAVNPLKQVPALVLPDGRVLTESAAILIWLGDSRPDAGLSPRLNDPRRAEYLRWMVYIPAAIYSMFWVRDDPSRLAADAAAEAVIKDRTAERIAECWRLMDAQVDPAPYILGGTLSLLDLYVTVVSRWTPGRRRFYAEAPKLADVVRRVDADPALEAFWPERFPFLPGWER
jgi:GST-like protein